MSPWALKRLAGVRRRHHASSASCAIMPSVLRQIAITKTEPGDENNQDISSLVGKIDIRKLEHFAQNDPDAYSYSGGLCLANQGLLEFVEMFKAPIKMLHPLLTATQEGNFKGTEGFSAIPVQRRDRRALATNRSGTASATTATTRPSSTASTSSRCRTASACRTKSRSTEKLLTNSSLVQGAVRARHARHDGAVLRPVAPQGARELEHLLQDARLRRRDAEGRRPQGQDAAGVPRLRRHRRRHERPVDPLRVQGAVGGVQPRPDRDRRQPGPPHVRARAAPRARGPARRDRGAATSSISRAGWRRATPSSSARRSRPPTSSRTPSTARTSSTAMSRLPTAGSRTRTTAIRKPARASTAARSTPSSRRSRSRSASPIRRTSATRS